MRTLRLSFVTTVAVVTIAIASGSVTSVVAQEPCGSESAEPGNPEALEQIQPWVRPLGFEDPVGDFFLDHPIYEENFDAPGVFNEVPIPDALDITGVDLVPEEESFNIRVLLERAREPELRALLEPGRRTANVGIYFDVDRNGVSDFLAITSDQGAVILPETLDEIVGEAGLDITDTGVSFDVPRDLVGDRFDWMAFTAFAPIDGAFFATPLDFMFFAPPVDMYTPQDLPANVGFTTTYVGTGVQCQVTSSQYNSCPAQGSPPQVSVPGTSYQGVLVTGPNAMDAGMRSGASAGRSSARRPSIRPSWVGLRDARTCAARTPRAAGIRTRTVS